MRREPVNRSIDGGTQPQEATGFWPYYVCNWLSIHTALTITSRLCNCKSGGIYRAEPWPGGRKPICRKMHRRQAWIHRNRTGRLRKLF